ELKRHVRRVDGMIGTIDQLRRDVDDRKSERTVLERVGHPLLHRGDVIARHDAALDFLGEGEAGAARQRLDVEYDIAVLAVTAGLLPVAAALHDALLDGLAIAD